MRIFILGGTGMLGHKLWQHLSRRFPQTYATVRLPHDAYARFGLFNDPRVIDNTNVEDFGSLERALQRAEPTVIVNCVAVTKRRDEATDTVANITLNALLPHNWLNGQRPMPLVSSASVPTAIRGNQRWVTEDDPTDAPISMGGPKRWGRLSQAMR